MRQRLTPTENVQRHGSDTPHRGTVCVVDGRPADYGSWLEIAQERDVEVRFFVQAADALRFARTRAIDLWVVNEDLPGLSGGELCEMLKAQSSRTAVYLVADEYSVAAEQSAWAHRATLFGAKPAHESWLAQWLAQRTVGRPGARLPAICRTT